MLLALILATSAPPDLTQWDLIMREQEPAAGEPFLIAYHEYMWELLDAFALPPPHSDQDAAVVIKIR